MPSISISQSQTSFSGNSQSLTSFSGNSSPASHPFWRKEQTFLFYPIVACVGFSCRTLQRMHVRGLVHSYTFLFDPSIASDWRTSIAPFWTDMCCRLKPTHFFFRSATPARGHFEEKGCGGGELGFRQRALRWFTEFRILTWQGVTARNWGLYNKWNMLCIRLIDQMVTFIFIF